MLLKDSSTVKCRPSYGSCQSLSEAISRVKAMKIKTHYSRLQLSVPHSNENVDLSSISDGLATEVLTDSFDEEEVKEVTMQKLKKVEYGYCIIIENFSVSLNKWLKQRKRIIADLRRAELKFRLMHRTTASITFLASALEFTMRVGLILQDLFDIKFDTNFPFSIVPVLGGISLTSSLLALSYSKTSLGDIANDLRDEKRLHIELETTHRKGNFIDDTVQELFPYGIDQKLINETILHDKGNKKDGKSWRHHLCSAIVLTNIKKDIKVLEDEDFLRTLKAFVRSNAALMWYNRVKLRKLLDEMSSMMMNEKVTKKELFSGNEHFLNLSAVNMYPVLLPIFFNDENVDKIRLITSSMTAVIAANSLRDKESNQFQELRNTCLTLIEEYKKIRKLNKDAFSDYE